MADYDWNPEDEVKKLEQKYGLGGSNRESDIADLARRNPEDRSRVLQEYEQQYQRRASSGQTGSGTDSTVLSGGNGNVQSANPQAATSQYSGGGGLGGDSALSALLAELQADRQRQSQQQSSLREMLMGQLNTLDDPVSLEAPGIREAVSANRLALQRGTEGRRREIAEQRAYDGSGGVGSKGYITDVDRLLQQQGEAGAQFEGNVMLQEMQQRRESLHRLLSIAMQLGDAESARNIQAQLSAIESQMGQGRFMDDLAFRYTGLNSQNNLAALMAILNAA
jgi:hypothetical protein